MYNIIESEQLKLLRTIYLCEEIGQLFVNFIGFVDGAFVKLYCYWWLTASHQASSHLKNKKIYI